ncbi:MAG: divergent polysaccharide deacetylase family protein [Sneathiella sp.]|nr:divergent polysaccharide deacetylase family protein [Sneathiella sp.]
MAAPATAVEETVAKPAPPLLGQDTESSSVKRATKNVLTEASSDPSPPSAKDASMPEAMNDDGQALPAQMAKTITPEPPSTPISSAVDTSDVKATPVPGEEPNRAEMPSQELSNSVPPETPEPALEKGDEIQAQSPPAEAQAAQEKTDDLTMEAEIPSEAPPHESTARLERESLPDAEPDTATPSEPAVDTPVTKAEIPEEEGPTPSSQPETKPEPVEPVAPTPMAENLSAAPEQTPQQVAPVSEAVPEKMLAWQEFASPFRDPQDRPRIAIVISEIGISKAGTIAAIEKLPGAFTLAFNPYGQDLQTWVNRARNAGHEVLLQIPMEPKGYPANDPGSQALLTSLTEAVNLSRLDWVLKRFSGYTGITNQMGSKFTASTEHIRPVLEVIKKKGLLYLDSRTASDSVAAHVAHTLEIPVAVNNRFLDHKADGATVDLRLTELEDIARRTGSAIGVAYPYPATFEHLSSWAKTLDGKGLALAPVSALINRQVIR